MKLSAEEAIQKIENNPDAKWVVKVYEGDLHIGNYGDVTEDLIHNIQNRHERKNNMTFDLITRKDFFDNFEEHKNG